MGRFERAALEVDEDAPAPPELLDRLEAQAAELARLNERYEQVQDALASERRMREDAVAWVEREHASLKKQKAEAGRSAAGADPERLRQELGAERRQSAVLNGQLDQAWTQIQALREQLDNRRGRLRRRSR